MQDSRERQAPSAEDGWQATMVPANHLAHEAAHLVAPQELAANIVRDTVQFLGLKEVTGVSQLKGPYVHVRPAGADATDVVLVGSWRTHHQPDGAANVPMLDASRRAPPPSGVAPIPGMGPGHGDAVGASHPPSGYQDMLHDFQAGGGAALDLTQFRNMQQLHAEPQQQRQWPIIEECPPDSDPLEQQRGEGADVAGSAASAPRVEEPADPDRMMEDVAAEGPAVHVVEGPGVGGAEHGQPAEGMVGLQGPGLELAGAVPSAAAAAIVPHPVAGAASAAIVPIPAATGAAPFALHPPDPMLAGPRPRSEWELEPSKIELGKRLAVGGFGEVFLAKYEGTFVAVKRLLAADSGTAQRFLDEVHMLARLRHPNLLLFMGYTLTPEPSIVTEFCARGSLFHILHQGGNRPLAVAMQRAVAVAVARGMAYLHSRQPPILHLDLKSPNVLIDERHRVKIADFGLSRVRQRTYVSSGAASGSPEWMAPEVLRCEHYAEAADVYSFGVVLWELLTGQAPWTDINAMQVVGAVGFAGRSLPDPTEGDELLLRMCKACRAHDPSQRPSFKQILAAMDEQYAPAARGAAAAAATDGNAEAAGPPAPPALPEAPRAAAPSNGPPAAPGGGGGPAAATAAEARAVSMVPPSANGGKDAPLAAAVPTTSIRMARRHSLAASPDPSDLLAAGAAGSASSGGAPARLDARFISAQESPRSRRRYRSPRGEEVGPPAVTARLQDGRKTPSPRTASARHLSVAAEEDEGGAFVWQEGAGAAAPRAPQPAAAAAGSGKVAVDASGARAPPMRGGSPFAALAGAGFAAGPGGSAQGVGAPAAPGAAAGGGGEGGPTDMEVSSCHPPALPPAHPQQHGDHRQQHEQQEPQEPQQGAQDHQQRPSLQSAPYGQPETGAAAAIHTAAPKQGAVSAPTMPRDASREPLQPTAGSAGMAQGLQQQHQVEQSPAQQQQQHSQGAEVQVEQQEKREQDDWQGQLRQPPPTELGRQNLPRILEVALGATPAAAGGPEAPEDGGSPHTGSPRPPRPRPSTAPPAVQQTPAADSPPASLPRAAPAHAAAGTAAAPQQQPFGSGSPGSSAAARQQLLGRLTVGRPGHRRVASAEAHLVQQQRLSAVLALAASGGSGTMDGGGSGGSGSGARAASGAAALAMVQQQRLLAAAAAAAGGAAAPGLPPGSMPPSGPRRSRGLARNSAPMRYTYGGAGTASGGPQQHGLPGRSHHSAHTLAQQLIAAEQHLRLAAGGASPAPSTPGGSGGGATPGAAASLGGSITLSPLLDAEWHPRGPPGSAPGHHGGGGGAAGGELLGSGSYDPWPDTTSELSFAFILGESGSMASDAELASASLDRLPLLEEDEALYAMSDDLQEEEPEPADSSGAEPEAEAAAEAAFELRPFPVNTAPLPGGGAASPPGSPSAAAPSPTSAFAAAAGNPPWATPAAGSAAAAAAGPAIEADWGFLPSLGSGRSPLLGGGHSHGVGEQPAPQHLQQPHGHSRTPQPPAPPQQPPCPAVGREQAVPQQLARSASGGEVLSYKLGRFKVTLEPAASAPAPDGGASDSGAPPLLPVPPLYQRSLPQPLSLTDAAGGGAAAAASPGPSPASRGGGSGSGIAPGLVGPSLSFGGSDGPHHHGGVLAGAGPPPVALNSVTMYRKGRFFISAHQHSAGAHCATTTMHPAHAAGSASGESGGHPAESEEGGHDGASGPASPRVGAGGAAAYGSGCSSPRGSGGGGGPASPVGGGRVSWAAVVAAAPPPAPEPSRPPVPQFPVPRQYSFGRFTVAESVVAAPPPDPRRRSFGSGYGADLAAAMPYDPMLRPPGQAAAAPVVFAHVTQTGAAADAALCRADHPAPQPPSPLLAARPPQPRLPLLGAASAAAGWGDADVGEAVAGGLAQALAGPPGGDQQAAVKRVGRFTVREPDREAQAGALDVYSRGPSASGTPTQAPAALGYGRAPLLPGGGSSSLLSSPPADDPMLLSSRHSSCSVASLSNCSRSSSASGLEMDMQRHQSRQGRKELTWRLPDPEQQPPPQPPQQQQAPALGQQRGPCAEVAAAAPSLDRPASVSEAGPSKIFRVKSKGRFTVFEHEEGALEGGQGAQGAQAQGALDGGQGMQGVQVQGAGAPPPEPAVQARQPRHSDEEGGGRARGAPAAEEGWSWELPGAAAGQAPYYGSDGGAAAALEPPFGGVLHPAVPPPHLHPQPTEGAAGLQPAARPAQGSPGAATAAPWGQSGPQGPEQQAQLRAEVARMVRERMERNNGGFEARRQEPQQGQRQQEGGAAGLPAGGGEDAGDGDGARCTYELTIGAGLRIQISHQLPAGGAGAGAGAGGEDAVMMDVDVGIGDGSSSDGEGEVEAGVGAQGVQGAGGGEPDLQPPDTPAYERPASPELPEPGQLRRRAGHSMAGDDSSSGGAGGSGSEGEGVE